MADDWVEMCPVCERSLTPKMMRRHEAATGTYGDSEAVALDGQAMQCPTCKSELRRGSAAESWRVSAS